MRPGLIMLGVLALLGVFLAARFPYERLLPALLELARGATGAEVEVAEIGLRLGPTGPRVVASGVALAWPESAPLVFDAVAFRPAWSLDWLSGRPLWHVEASGPPGTWRGELARDRVAGELEEIDVAALPWRLFGATAPLQGRLSGTVDLTRLDGSWRGSAQLAGAPGTVDLAGLPVAIPYQLLVAQLDLASERVNLSSARLEGPLVTANFVGSASAAGGAFSSWPLDLAVEIERVDPALGNYLAPLGIHLDRGRANLRVTGTLSAPFLSGLSGNKP